MRYKEKMAMWQQRQRLKWCIYQPKDAKDCQQMPEEVRKDSPVQVSEGAQPCHLDFQTSSLQNWTLSHSVCGTLLQKH